MYPTQQIRRHKIIRILLILFIVNQVVSFVFGVPVAVREDPEGRIDADGTTASQKQVNPVEEGSTSMAGQTPPSPDRTETVEMEELSTGSTGSNLMPPMPPPPLRPPRPIYPRPLRPYRPYRPYESLPLRPMDPPPQPEERVQPASSLTTDKPSTSQQNSGPDLDVHPPPHPEQPSPNSEPPPQSNPNPEPRPSAAAEMPIDEALDMLKNGKIKRTFPAP